MPAVSPSKYRVQAGWRDVPHIDEQTQAELLASTPENEREARTEGKPSLGTGAIYPVPEDQVLEQPFVIPNHWPRVYALDPGWRTTAVLWGALEREADCWHMYTEHYRGKAEPATHAVAIKARGAWIPGLIDPAPGTNLQDGERMLEAYRSQGLNLMPADNSVEAGIYETWLRLSTGRLKVFSTLQNWLAEYRLYRRAEKQTELGPRVAIVKQYDHLMDCMRYIVMSGVTRAAVPPVPGQYQGATSGGGDSVAGY